MDVVCVRLNGFVDLIFHFLNSGVLIEADKMILVIGAAGERRVDAETSRVVNVNSSRWGRQSKRICYDLFSLKLLGVLYKTNICGGNMRPSRAACIFLCTLIEK